MDHTFGLVAIRSIYISRFFREPLQIRIDCLSQWRFGNILLYCSSKAISNLQGPLQNGSRWCCGESVPARCWFPGRVCKVSSLGKGWSGKDRAEVVWNRLRKGPVVLEAFGQCWQMGSGVVQMILLLPASLLVRSWLRQLLQLDKPLQLHQRCVPGSVWNN